MDDEPTSMLQRNTKNNKEQSQQLEVSSTCEARYSTSPILQSDADSNSYNVR